MEEFQNWLLAEFKNKNTAKSYYYIARKFFKNYEFTEQDINKYASTLIDRSKSTQNQFLKAMNAYKKFKKSDIRLPKYAIVDQKEHNFITEDEFNKKLLPQLVNIFRYSHRIICALKFMYYTGVRRNEFLTLKRTDINLKNMTATLRGTKGKKDRNVHISKKIIKDLTAYFVMEPENQNAFNITDTQLDNIMKEINELKLFDFKIHPHLFRHSCAKDMCRRGVSDGVIQKILGHKNIKTTMLYIDPNETMVKEMYHKFMD